MKENKFESYFGRKIAIDASMSIYQFLIVVGRSGTEMLTNEAGEVTSHLQGMFSRTIRLLEAGIKPLYIFDGKPPDLKRQELAKRYSKRADATEDLSEALETGNIEDIEKYSKRTVKVTKQHNEDCKKLLRLMGVPVVEAPSEAEAQCAALCKAGKVYAVASEDMDSLTFGAPKFLRHLMDPSSKKIPVMEFEVAKILEELNLTMDQFIDLCILSGCDYCESIRGIGGLTALKLIRQHGSIENMLENINKERYHIPDNWPYQEARRLFKEPLVLTDEKELDIKWSAPDEEGLITFLVNENGFNTDRVTKAIEKIKAAKSKSSQGRLESFFKPTPNSSVPIKRKETPGKNDAKETNKKAKGSGVSMKEDQLAILTCVVFQICIMSDHTMKLANLVLLVTLVLLLATSISSDPDLLQDLCVADLASGVKVNGFTCKEASKVNASDFFSNILAKPGATNNTFGSLVTGANVEKVPGLNTLGVSVSRIDYAPDGINPPHTHPRATEIVFVLEGQLDVGFITTANVLISKTINKGEIFVFPKGLVHFQKNNANVPAAVISAFNSQLPGTQSIATTLFASTPSLPDHVLTKTFQVGTKEVQKIKTRLAPKK
ncbi:unnamed protein product [Sphenostylis stenocarpa]|uniref:Flap endonuclease 1 n=1 Tax=Sphenostylis stenocarpa TaxID=92480 RepID=A0AA86W4V0_9FABA|nr:unnamed protein product [Sphenostylis stenocarpa]